MSHTAFKLILSEEFPVIPHPTQGLWRAGQNHVVQTSCRTPGMPTTEAYGPSPLPESLTRQAM